jgi:hypothetical protein
VVSPCLACHLLKLLTPLLRVPSSRLLLPRLQCSTPQLEIHIPWSTLPTPLAVTLTRLLCPPGLSLTSRAQQPGQVEEETYCLVSTA